MGLALVLVSAVFAYSASGLALWFGAGWLMALLVLSGTGTISVLGLGFLATRAPRNGPHPSHAQFTD